MTDTTLCTSDKCKHRFSCTRHLSNTPKERISIYWQSMCDFYAQYKNECIHKDE